jgi:predicted RNA-binding protein with TRAM domain
MRFERGGFGGRRFGGGGGRGFGRGGGFRSNDRFSDEPKPVKVGEEYDVEISETGSRGDGIARVNNFVVFVNGAKQGEKTKIKITDVRNRFAIGEKVGESGAAVSEDASAEDSVAEVAAEEGDEESEESDEKSEESEDKEE